MYVCMRVCARRKRSTGNIVAVGNVVFQFQYHVVWKLLFRHALPWGQAVETSRTHACRPTYTLPSCNYLGTPFQRRITEDSLEIDHVEHLRGNRAKEHETWFAKTNREFMIYLGIYRISRAFLGFYFLMFLFSPLCVLVLFPVVLGKGFLGARGVPAFRRNQRPRRSPLRRSLLAFGFLWWNYGALPGAAYF